MAYTPTRGSVDNNVASANPKLSLRLILFTIVTINARQYERGANANEFSII